MKLTIVGLTGMMGAGKTTVADKLVANYGYRKLTFATPLYRLSKLTSQVMMDDQLAEFELYNQLMDLFGSPGAAPPFGAVASLVLEGLPDLAEQTFMIENMKAGRKPRAFLQQSGDYFRGYKKDIFANYMRRVILNDVRKAREEYYSSLDGGTTFLSGDPSSTTAVESLPSPHLKIVIDDVRFQNEVDSIQRAATESSSLYSPIVANSYVIKLAVSQDIAVQRVAQRDSLEESIVAESMNHSSEDIDSLHGVSHLVDATDDIEHVTANVLSILTGRPSSSFLSSSDDTVSKVADEMGYQQGTKLVDISQFRKEDETNGN